MAANSRNQSKKKDQGESKTEKPEEKTSDKLFDDAEKPSAQNDQNDHQQNVNLNVDGMESGSPAKDPPAEVTPAAPLKKDPLESVPSAGKVKEPPMRVTSESPVCPIHWAKMKVVSTQGDDEGTTRYYACKAAGCSHTDATFESGLALDRPVPCPKQRCRERGISMHIDREKTARLGNLRLQFFCPNCGHEDTRSGPAMDAIAKRRNVKKDIIRR